MPGDVVNAEVYAKYLDPDDDNWTTALNTFITQLPSAGTSGMVIDGSGYMQSGSTTLPFTAIDHEGDAGTAPKAYLNYIFVNREYDPASVKLLPVRMTEAARENGTDVDHEKLTLSETITEPGYVYIYLSNDNINLGGRQIEVYFDDFKVTHNKSPVVQQDEYYAFGLTFNGYYRETV